MVDWGRPEYIRHMLEENLSICFMRQFSGDKGYNHFLVSKYMVDNRTFFSSKGIIQQAPLYLYKERKSKKFHSQSMMLFEPEVKYDSQGRIPNIDDKLYEKLNKTYNKKLRPEEILYYIYAIFFSNYYREKYSEFLKIDFPRVPFTSDYNVFSGMVKLGNQLVDLHLMKSNLLDNPVSKYYGDSENDRIEQVLYDEKELRVYINKEKYFDNISAEIWNYQIGGYQVLQKYLKDRKGRIMDDSRYYCRVVTALDKTIQIQKDLDEIYKIVEKDLIEF
jgi:predicted helicase